MDSAPLMMVGTLGDGTMGTKTALLNETSFSSQRRSSARSPKPDGRARDPHPRDSVLDCARCCAALWRGRRNLRYFAVIIPPHPKSARAPAQSMVLARTHKSSQNNFNSGIPAHFNRTVPGSQGDSWNPAFKTRKRHLAMPPAQIRPSEKLRHFLRIVTGALDVHGFVTAFGFEIEQ